MYIGSDSDPVYSPNPPPASVPEGHAVDVDVTAPKQSAPAQYIDEKIPERIKSAEMEKPVEEAQKPPVEDVNNSSIDKSAKSGIIKENIEIGRSLGAASKNYPIKLPTGNHGKILEGTEVTDVVTFAGKGTKTPIRNAKVLEELYGIPAAEWEKVRGTAYIRAGNVNKKAELHWYEARGVRVEMKVKKYYDED